ncbi:hypothetical protein BDP81DRAFT_159910 [Colletotrichum phormii]|uniref:Uncharacterized protein n=1 Tax=Colletotrichum phormii TaxID=359342 RepID=A0AAI9ZXX2_9PEZI|nr:uncharacterized protein BDP81DRAFT_159910 [Colletotrichum phormii]KAK1640216.1 hypothetical protein BDP81DRAFT_159910 [Colletotrichum phormii]
MVLGDDMSISSSLPNKRNPTPLCDGQLYHHCEVYLHMASGPSPLPNLTCPKPQRPAESDGEKIGTQRHPIAMLSGVGNDTYFQDPPVSRPAGSKMTGWPPRYLKYR